HYTLQWLILFSLGLMRAVIIVSGMLLLCGSVVASTIAQHFFRDPSFKLYSVIFRVTQAPDGSVTDVHFVEANDIRWQHEHPGAKMRQQIVIPQSYITGATKKARATR